MTAWKLNDTVWMKQRREEWKKMKRTLDIIGCVRRDCAKSEVMKEVKAYFLTGKEPEKYPFNNPVVYEVGLLMELLLDPDHSEKNWQRIIENHKRWESYEVAKRNRSSKNQSSDPEKQKSDEAFINAALNRSLHMAREAFLRYAYDTRYEYLNVTGVSFFYGLEERLYRTLCPQHFRREDYPLYNDERFKEVAQRKFWSAGAFAHYLETPKKELKPYTISRLYVPIWRDAIMLGGYNDRPELAKLITAIDKYLKAPLSYDETQVQLANEVLKVINDPNIPQELKDKIEELRKPKPPQSPQRETPWQIRSKDWMKDRLQSWGKVEQVIKTFEGVNDQNIKVLKRFYMTGQQSAPNLLNSPAIKGGLLFELWFDPGEEEEHFPWIVKEYSDIQVLEAKKLFLHHVNDETNPFVNVEGRLEEILNS